jgi:hypothetical protein
MGGVSILKGPELVPRNEEPQPRTRNIQPDEEKTKATATITMMTMKMMMMATRSDVCSNLSHQDSFGGDQFGRSSTARG